MADAYVLSDRDVRVLREMMREFSQRRENTQSRSEQGTPSAAPEVYVARAPLGGVPGVTDGYIGTGTGTGSLASDEPGYADCSIHRIVVDGTGTPYLKSVAYLSKRVYNLSTHVILGQSWFLVSRDKFGYWIAGGPVDLTSDGTTGLGGPGQFIGPVHVVDGSGTGTGDWYCQLVERSGSNWVVSAGPIDYSGVVEINGLTPRKIDSSATPGAVALAVTNLFADANGAYYIDYPLLADSASDSFSTPLTWTGICNADGTITISPATYQTVTITSAWDNWSDFPRINVTLDVS